MNAPHPLQPFGALTLAAATPAHPKAAATFLKAAARCPADLENDLELWTRWVKAELLDERELAVALFVLARPRVGESPFVRARRYQCSMVAQVVAAEVPLTEIPTAWASHVLITWSNLAVGASEEAREEKGQGIDGRIAVAARHLRREVGDLLKELEWRIGDLAGGKFCSHCDHERREGHDPNCLWPKGRARLAELEAGR